MESPQALYVKGAGDEERGRRGLGCLSADLQRDAQSLGRPAIVLDVDAVARLLRTMVELEGGQTAFASRHGIERTTINAILSGKRPVTESVANALWRTYTAK